MDYTYEQLKHKTVAELREIAKGNEHEALQGYTQLNKEHLLVALSKALGIKHEHHEVVGVDKASIKARIREMKQHRDDAIAAHDHAKLKVARRTIHRLKRQIHKATVWENFLQGGDLSALLPSAAWLKSSSAVSINRSPPQVAADQSGER